MTIVAALALLICVLFVVADIISERDGRPK